MITSTPAKQTPVPDDFAFLSLRLLWCSDCHGDQLFERPPAEGAHAPAMGDPHGEWACTDCGAAYFDGIDVVTAHDDAKRGVA